jgi:putative transposase
MQMIKSITARNIFKEYPEIRKQLWGGELWSDGGYIGTVGDGTTSDIISVEYPASALIQIYIHN